MKSYNKILAIAVIVLLLVNLLLLFFMWRGKHSESVKRQSTSNSSTEIMARELNMTDSQKTNYQKARDNYFSNVRPLYDSIREKRKEFLKMIQSPSVNDSALKTYSQGIAEKQEAIDRITLLHFRDTRSLFSGEQQKKYDDFIQKTFLRRRDTASKKK